MLPTHRVAFSLFILFCLPLLSLLLSHATGTKSKNLEWIRRCKGKGSNYTRVEQISNTLRTLHLFKSWNQGLVFSDKI